MSGLNEVLAVYLMATKLGIIKMATKLGLIKMATKLGIINQEWIQNAQKQNVHKKPSMLQIFQKEDTQISKHPR